MSALYDEVLRAFDRGDAEVERATVEVNIGDRRALVSVAVIDGELVVVSSDGDSEGPFAEAALRFLAGEAPAVREKEATSTKAARASVPPKPKPFAPLADALDELLTAVARSGVDAAASATPVEEALEQVLRTAPSPTPVGLGRVVGRLRHALSQRDVDTTARVLEGTARLVRHLRSDGGSRDDATRLSVWLDQPELRERMETVHEREMFEVAREWVAGTERRAIQRRYLICTKTGEVFCEERARHHSASIGPSPRQLKIGLAEVRRGAVPRRIRLLQYEVTAELGNGLYRVEQVAQTRFDRLVELYRKSLLSFPALAEPVAVVKARLHAGGLLLRDSNDQVMALVGDDALLARVSQVTEESELRWVAGKLVDVDGTLALEPLSLALRRGGSTAFERLQ